MTTAGLIHTVPALGAELHAALAAALPGRRIVSVTDPSLLASALESGVTPALVHAVAAHACHLGSLGARAVLLTCSSVGPAAGAAGHESGVPIARIDAPMAREAARLARAAGAKGRIAVLAALESTLGPTTDLIASCLPEGSGVETAAQVVPGAAAARAGGDGALADRLIAEAAERLAPDVDAIVLAQASMAGAAALVQAATPVLSSPASGIATFAGLLESLEALAALEPLA